MAKCSLTSKVLELVAREVGEAFTGYEIVQLLEDFGFERDQINYPNTKWVTVLEAFKLLRDNEDEPDIEIAKLIDVFLNPLNHEPNADNAHKLADSVKRYLAYNKFTVEFDGAEYYVTAPSEQTDWNDVDNFFETKKEEEKKEKLPKNKDLLYQIRDYHQTYIDVLEIFCENTKKPEAKHNQAYLTLRKKIPSLIADLKLKHNKIDFYEPFAGDLYSAELEWNGTGDTLDIRIGPLLSWDAIRPRLHKTHSEIVTLITAVEKEEGLSDDELMLESITELVTEHRAKKAKSTKKNGRVQKIEVLHKQAKDEKPIVKIADHDLSFDDDISTLHIGEGVKIKFPSYKNEHLLLRHMFGCRVGEGIDWEQVYESISGVPQDKTNKDDIEKLKKKVRDTINAINKRVSEGCKTDSKLITMQGNALIRHY